MLPSHPRRLSCTTIRKRGSLRKGSQAIAVSRSALSIEIDTSNDASSCSAIERSVSPMCSAPRYAGTPIKTRGCIEVYHLVGLFGMLTMHLAAGQTISRHLNDTSHRVKRPGEI